MKPPALPCRALPCPTPTLTLTLTSACFCLLSVFSLLSALQMVLLAKLLPRLQAEGHKVLIFSQMVRCLDLIEVRVLAALLSLSVTVK